MSGDGSEQAEPLSGRATVVDGDSLEIDGISIRIFGIDAFEGWQYCHRPDGTRWRCGHHATVELDRMIEGRTVVCSDLGKDTYGRTLSVCRAGGRDLARELVLAGLAVAYRRFSSDYESAEEQAQRSRTGAWAGSFEMPWDWRARMRGR